MAVLTQRAVSVSGFPGADDLTVVRIDVPSGATWGQAVLAERQGRTPGLAEALGKVAIIKLGTETIFQGIVIDQPAHSSVVVDRPSLIVADVRWLWTKRRVGQTGLGSADGGGFPGVGYWINFNERGRKNRSAERNGDGVYDFSHAEDAEWWTLGQALETLVHYYAAEVVVPALPAGFEAVEMDVELSGWMVLDAIQELCQRAGAAWGLEFSGGGGLVVWDENGVGALGIHVEAADGKTTSVAGSASAVGLTVSSRIADSVDRVEVQSGRVLVETTYSTDPERGPPLLSRILREDTEPPWENGVAVDVTHYEAHGLGANLAPGTRPYPWARENITRRTVDGSSYLGPEAGPALQGRGRPVRPTEALWVRFGGVVYQVLGGFMIDYERGQLWLERVLQVSWLDGGGRQAGTLLLPYGDFHLAEVYLTAATELPVVQFARSAAPSENLSVEGQALDVVRRTDLIPRARRKALLPPLDPAEQWVEVAPDGMQAYVDVTGALEGIASRRAALLTRKETEVVATLVDVPAGARVGQKLTVAPKDLRLTGREVVSALAYDLEERHRLAVRASSSLGRVLAGVV